VIGLIFLCIRFAGLCLFSSWGRREVQLFQSSWRSVVVWECLLWDYSILQAMAKVLHTPTRSDGRSDRYPLKEQLSPEPLGRKTPRSKTPKRPVHPRYLSTIS